MTDRAHQTELASAIADGTVSFLQQYERKVGGGDAVSTGVTCTGCRFEIQ